MEIRQCTEIGKDCSNCKHSYTDGFYAPNMWCKLHQNKGENNGFDIYMRIDDKDPGSICDDFEIRQ